MNKFLICFLLSAIPAAAASPDCNNSANQHLSACIGSKPAFCEQIEFQNALACFHANPSYCANDVNQNVWACAASKPAYCKKSEYQNAGACLDLVQFCKTTGRVALADCLEYALKFK